MDTNQPIYYLRIARRVKELFSSGEDLTAFQSYLFSSEDPDQNEEEFSIVSELISE